MKPSLFIILLSWTMAACANAGQIEVVDATTKKGLVSEIYKETAGKRTREGTTNAAGIFLTREPGKRGELFFAVNQEYDPNSTPCPVTQATIPLKKTRLIRSFDFKAQFYASAGEFSAAAFQYKQAAEIAKRQGNTKAAFFEAKAAEALARQWSIEKPFLPSSPGTKPEPSSEFSDKIIKFQRSKGVEPDGKLTMETYKKAAGDKP